MSVTHSRLSRTGTVGAVAALVGSALLFASPAQAANRVIDDLHVNADETRSTGHNEFLGDGVRVYTEGSASTDKAAGYFAVNKPLADAGEPNMDWENNGQTGNVKPSVQLVVDYDGDGAADGILVGEPTYADGTTLYGNDWWLTNGSKAGFKALAPSNTGGSGSANHGTLDQWRTAAPDAEVLSAGWSLGSGVKGDGIIHRITVGSTNYFFSKASISDVTLYRSDFNLSETRATGHNDFRPVGGIRVYTEGSTSTDKAAGYFTVNTPLAGTGEPNISFRMTSGTVPPSTQLGVDFDNDGVFDGYLVGEPTFYGNDWWLSNGSPQTIKDQAPSHTGGSGSANHGTLNQWRSVFPDAKILTGGYSLGSGVKADGVLSAITIGAKRYLPTGKDRAPSAVDVTATTRGGNPSDEVDVTLVGTDPDTEDTLTYTSAEPEHGTAEIDGDTLTYTPDADFDGTDSFTYTVDDGRGSSVSTTTADVTVTVTPNGAPVVEDIDASTGTNAEVDVTLAATDPDGDPITFTVGAADDGTVELDGNTATYTPEEDFAGTDSFTYTATDDHGGSAQATVSVTVAANQPPVANNYSVMSRVGVDSVTTLVATDPEGDALTYATTSPGASIVDNKLTISIPKSSIAPRSATYTVTDSKGLSDTATVTVSLLKANPKVSFFFTQQSHRAGKAARVGVTVKSSASVTNGYVDAYVNGKKVGSGRLPQSGYVGVSLGKSRKGTYDVKLRFRGTSLNNPVALTQKLTVK